MTDELEAATAVDVKLLRTLGQHERFCLARHNIGSPPVLCIFAVGTLNDESEMNGLHSVLGERVRYCLDHVPHLSSFVHGQKSFQPRFARKQSGEIRVSDVLGEIEMIEKDEELRPERLMNDMQRWSMSGLELTKPPLWRVRLLVHQPSNAFAIVLQTHHIITDGMAMCNLFQLLVLPHDATLPHPSDLLGSTAATRDEYLPPTSNETMATVAPLSWTAMKLFKTLALPALPLPYIVKRRIGSLRSWPQGETLLSTAASADVRWHYVEVKNANAPSGLMTALKKAALDMNVKSINPILHTCAMIALHVFLKRKTCVVSVQTAASERKVGEHGMICGNFVSVFDWTQEVDASLNVGKVTQQYASDLTSPAALYQRSRTWSLMPDVFGAYGQRRHRVTDDQPTEWEAYFLAKANSASPYSASIGLSNIGLLAKMDDRIRCAAWAQVAQPIGDAFTLDILGWRKATNKEADGLSIFVSLRTDVFCHQDQQLVFINALQTAVTLFAHGNIDGRSTFADAAELISRNDKQGGD